MGRNARTKAGALGERNSSRKKNGPAFPGLFLDKKESGADFQIFLYLKGGEKKCRGLQFLCLSWRFSPTLSLSRKGRK